MSRLAPTIPVDLNTRRVLVDDLVSRVPRCDCCPTATCADCPQPTLLPSVVNRFRIQGDTDWTVTRQSTSLVCSELDFAFAADEFDPNRPFLIGRLPFPTGIADVSGVPAGGVAEVRWHWEQAIDLAGSRGAARILVRLDTFLRDDALIYVLALYIFTPTDMLRAVLDGLLPPTWFEQGLLPTTVSPCAPPIFPVRLVADHPFASADVTVRGYANA